MLIKVENKSESNESTHKYKSNKKIVFTRFVAYHFYDRPYKYL